MPLTNLNKQRMESSSGLFPDEFCPLVLKQLTQSNGVFENHTDY